MEINDINFTDFEEKIIGKSRQEIENLLDFPLESKCDEEYILYLKGVFSGFKKKLFLYFHKGIVRDYYIGIG